ncbi:MAG: hypothetical protein JW741_04635, partial [Sedimentisphaerales bacterium]|nr:hypothetical protein [Sedimentisphaerales bacterium]
MINGEQRERDGTIGKPWATVRRQPVPAEVGVPNAGSLPGHFRRDAEIAAMNVNAYLISVYVRLFVFPP